MKTVKHLFLCAALLSATNAFGNEQQAEPTNQGAITDKPGKLKWSDICKKYKNSVVQVISFVNVFNLEDPSKTGADQFVGAGTGFFISNEKKPNDQYILTNYHVVRDAPVIKIRFPALGEQTFDVDLVGCYPKKDYALLKITDSSLKSIKELLKTDELTCFELGDSDKVVEAEEIMTLGYPYGQRNLKSSIGNVSGPQSMDEIGECIQTTTPLNPGNSGGPFLDKAGKVIGIATLKNPEAEGIAYLIPINTIKIDLDELYNRKIIKKALFGLAFHASDENTLKFLDLPTDGGVYVCSVVKQSLADQAGLKKGDVIYCVDDIKLDRSGYIHPTWRDARISLSDYFGRLKIGQTVKLTVYRDKQELTINITMPEYEPFAINNFYPWLEEAPDYERVGGIVVVQLTLNHIGSLVNLIKNEGVGDLSAVLKYSKHKKRFSPRVLITTIYPGSVASDVHFSADDVIIKKVNGIKVKTVEDFRNAVLAGCKENPDYLTIENEGGTFAALPIQDLLDEEERITAMNYLNESELVVRLAEKFGK